MNDFDHHAAQHQEAEGKEPSPRTAFHAQFNFLPKSQQQPVPPNIDHYGAGIFNMGPLAGALPQIGPRGSISSHSPYEADGVLSPSAIYHMQQHAAHFASQRAPSLDMSAALRHQAQHLPALDCSPTDRRFSTPMRGSSFNMSPNMHRIDSYGYNMAMPQFSPIDPRFNPQAYPMNARVGSVGSDYGQYSRRSSEALSIPSFPRGPPRKPRQSGHALWVGNLPPAATVIDLKDHFSRDATKDIESVFLISKSNCAFVNYRTEAACVAAMNRFHDSRFHGVRLVCRLRRGSSMSSRSPSIVPSLIASPITEDEKSPEVDGTPTIVGSDNKKPDGLPEGDADGENTTATAQQQSREGAGTDAPKIPEKYFIIKSLTVQDLEASVLNGIWATQSHNESVLNDAYNGAETVYLIFSANKSGEYFGYARMASLISGEPVNLAPPAPSPAMAQSAVTTPTDPNSASPGTPRSIVTPATETAPKGRIVDDSARGTIFWEAEHSDDGSANTTTGGETFPDHNNNNNDNTKERNESTSSSSGGGGQTWGKQFQIEWRSTARLPFYRTRGLRNPWNANREVKIARDGTELEPGVGRRLVQMFHRPPPPMHSHSHGPPMGHAPQGLGLQHMAGIGYQ